MGEAVFHWSLYVATTCTSRKKFREEMEGKFEELFNLIKENKAANEKVFEDLKHRLAMVETSGPCKGQYQS